jgi:hypothetical protein
VSIVALLALTVLVFAWPEVSLAMRGIAASYAVVTVALTLLITGLVIGWREEGESAAGERPVSRHAAAGTAFAAAAMVLLVAHRWVRLIAWLPYHADMLIVIREATRRFLSGQMPYVTYRSYDTSWDMVMPYGPALWGPFLIPQLLRLDFRVITIVGELFVPIWCGVAGVVEASRGKTVNAIAWLVLLAALLLALDVQRFTLIAHTPVYWPLFLPLAVTIRKRQWTASALLLGLLVVARQTMVSMMPVFVIAVWMTDRRDAIKAIAVLALTIGVAIVPFLAWDARAVWESMVLSYPRVMKSAVWPVLARPGLETIGVTEWLIEHHREWLVTPVQVAALSGVFTAAWAAIRRGRRPLPWMALALFAFSMTTLYPVHYLYYDVLLLLVCGRLAETLTTAPVSVTLKVWTLSLAGAAVVVLVAVRTVASPLPSIAAGQTSNDRPLRDGFAASESDGSRNFAWIVGNEARLVLPRSSASAADLVLVAQSPFREHQPPQRMAAILNGTLLSETIVPAGWQELRFAAPRSAWWIGFNELQLRFSSTVSPRDAGSGTDPRHLALGVSRVDVVKKTE